MGKKFKNLSEHQQQNSWDFIQIIPLPFPVDAVFEEKGEEIKFSCLCTALRRDGDIVLVAFDADGLFDDASSAGNFLRYEKRKGE